MAGDLGDPARGPWRMKGRLLDQVMIMLGREPRRDGPVTERAQQLHRLQRATNREQLTDLTGFRCAQLRLVVGTAVQFADPWAFEVNTEEDSLINER